MPRTANLDSTTSSRRCLSSTTSHNVKPPHEGAASKGGDDNDVYKNGLKTDENNVADDIFDFDDAADDADDAEAGGADDHGADLRAAGDAGGDDGVCNGDERKQEGGTQEGGSQDEGAKKKAGKGHEGGKEQEGEGAGKDMDEEDKDVDEGDKDIDGKGQEEEEEASEITKNAVKLLLELDEPVLPTDGYAALYAKLKAVGFQHKPYSTSLKFDYYYLLPGGRTVRKGGKGGVDFLEGEEGVENWAKQWLGWVGDQAADQRDPSPALVDDVDGSCDTAQSQAAKTPPSKTPPSKKRVKSGGGGKKRKKGGVSQHNFKRLSSMAPSTYLYSLCSTVVSDASEGGDIAHGLVVSFKQKGNGAKGTMSTKASDGNGNGNDANGSNDNEIDEGIDGDEIRLLVSSTSSDISAYSQYKDASYKYTGSLQTLTTTSKSLYYHGALEPSPCLLSEVPIKNRIGSIALHSETKMPFVVLDSGNNKVYCYSETAGWGKYKVKDFIHVMQSSSDEDKHLVKFGKITDHNARLGSVCWNVTIRVVGIVLGEYNGGVYFGYCDDDGMIVVGKALIGQLVFIHRNKRREFAPSAISSKFSYTTLSSHPAQDRANLKVWSFTNPLSVGTVVKTVGKDKVKVVYGRGDDKKHVNEDVKKCKVLNVEGKVG